MKLPVSISIGIGVGGSLSENDMYARNALDMALGRGGDQVSIKDDTQYKFTAVRLVITKRVQELKQELLLLH